MMSIRNVEKPQWLVLFIMVLAASLLVVQCGDSESTSEDELVQCTSHEECPVGMNCIISEGICGEDSVATECYNDFDCADGYMCAIPVDSADGLGKCIPGETPIDGDSDGAEEAEDIPCSTDADCMNPDLFCINGMCEERFPECKNNNECWPGQICNPDTGRCEGQVDPTDGDEEVPSTDGDDPVDGDEEVPPTDGDDPVDGDTDVTPTDGDQPDGDGGDRPCDRTGDCPAGEVCLHGVCSPSCEETGCTHMPGSHCNPNNGYCECCEDLCASDRMCNFYWQQDDSFWYCGSPCTPPCQDGYACQSGECVEVRCPTCRSNQSCGADTCYVCEDSTTPDGDGGERGGFSCLPANTECIEGVDVCCSGTCLMGTCL